MRVGRLLIVLEVIPPAAAGDVNRKVNAQAPAAKIERMHAVIAQLAVAVMPEPVPIVVDAIAHERLARGRALPQSRQPLG